MNAGAVQGAVQGFKAVDVFLGLGSPAEKSDELLLLSVHPAFALITALVLEGAVVAPAPSKQFAVPKPTKSTTPIVGQLPLSAVLLFTSATLPVVADIAIEPVASGAGSDGTPGGASEDDVGRAAVSDADVAAAG